MNQTMFAERPFYNKSSNKLLDMTILSNDISRIHNFDQRYSHTHIQNQQEKQHQNMLPSDLSREVSQTSYNNYEQLNQEEIPLDTSPQNYPLSSNQIVLNKKKGQNGTILNSSSPMAKASYRSIHQKMLIKEPEKKFIRQRTKRMGTGFSRLSGLHEIDNNNLKNFKNQHKKYDVRQKNFKLTSQALKKFKKFTNKITSFNYLNSARGLKRGEFSNFLGFFGKFLY